MNKTALLVAKPNRNLWHTIHTPCAPLSSNIKCRTNGRVMQCSHWRKCGTACGNERQPTRLQYRLGLDPVSETLIPYNRRSQ